MNGDNAPITTTALIEIITTPPVITNPSLEFCAGSPINLTLSTSGGQVNWYTDSLLTNHIHTGGSFDPTGAPTFIDNSTGGSYSFWVTETIGACASAPSRVSFRIFDTPAPIPHAGADEVVCSNSYILKGNTPVIGTGLWSTTSSAIIGNPSDPHSTVSNLEPGPNLFRWILTNGPCVSVDEVIITSDLQPAPADAGPDQNFCNNTSAILHAETPTNNGIGTWTLFIGSAVFIDNHNPRTTASSIAGGENDLVWTVRSRYGVCLITTDTLQILRDRIPNPANAGPDRGVCDSSAINMAALPAGNGGTGTWSVISGGAIITDIHSAISHVSNLAIGNNQFRWSVSSQYGICPGSNDMVTISRDEAPAPALAGGDQNLCSSSTAPLGANSATVGTGSWSLVSGPVATAPVFMPSAGSPNATAHILPGNEGIYRFAWLIVNGSCRTSDTLTVDFGLPVPPADAGPADSVCGTNATLNGNNPGIGTGTWQKISGTGITAYLPGIHSPSVIAQIDAGETGYYTFEWRIRSGSCPQTADTVGILFKPMPDPPATFDTAICGAGALTLYSIPGAGGDINRWYKNSSGGIMLLEDNNYNTPVLTTDTVYWVSSYNYTTGCESFRRRLDVMVNAVPGMPGVTDIQQCGNGSLHIPSVVGSNGTTNRWYHASSGGVLLAETDTFITPVLAASITYWVSSFNSLTGCVSGRTPVNINIDPIPGIPSASDTSRCGEGSMVISSSLGSNGTSNQWYDAPTGGTLLDTALNMATPYLTASESYWITTYNENTGCRSPRHRVNVNIHPIPGFPNTSDVTQCGPDTMELIATPGINGTISRWYDSITGGNLLMQGNDYITEYLISTRHYYVSTYNESTHCESSRRDVLAVVLPVPGVSVIIGPDAVGLNQTNVIYSVNFHPGSTYEWTIPPGIDSLLESQNFIMLQFPNLGIYNITVVETNSIGCVGPPATKPIEVKADLIILDIDPINGSGCINTDLQLSVLPTGGTPSYTFLWGGNTLYLNAVDIANPIFTAPLEGTYMLTVTVNDINLNHTTDTLWVTVHPNPLAEIPAGDTVVCAGSSLPLQAIVSGGSGVYTTYTWSGQTTPLSGTDITDPYFNSWLRGIYSLLFTVEDNNGCTATDSLSIFNDSPLSSFTSDAVPGCSPLSVGFTNTSENAVSYLWNFGDFTTSSLSDPTHVFSNTTTSVQYFNVQLTAISTNNCMHTSNDYVTVYPNPVLTISTYPDKACAPADILLSSTPGGFRYDWNFGDGTQASGDFNMMHTFQNDTDRDTAFTIQLISTSFFGCEDTGQTIIEVHPSPEALFNVDPITQMIPDRTVTIGNTTEPGDWDYQWRFGDDSTSVVRDPGSHMYAGPGRYLIYLVVRGEHCADSSWVSVEVVPHPPIAAFKPVEPGCMPLTIQFENTSAYSTSFLWEFGDGAVSNKPNPEYTYYEPGTFSIKLTAWGDNGTADSYSKENEVYVLPNAFFDIKPRRVYANDQSVLFDNQSDNGLYPIDGNRYLWDFGDGEGSEEKSPNHMYKREGNYDVTLNVWTNKGCYDIYEYKAAVLVEPVGRIVFPNVFSPEAQLEENKIFKPGIIDFVEEYHLMIFNRWGELIFESFSQDLGWNGIISGRPAKEDVYVWKVEGKYTNGQTFVQTGDVTLLH